MNAKVKIPGTIFTTICLVTLILITYLFWPVSFTGKSDVEKEELRSYCPNLITFIPEATQKNLFNNFFLSLLLPPVFFACVMKELDAEGQLTPTERLTYGMMFLIPNIGLYKPRYDLHAYFLQQEKNPGIYEYRTLARYYETGTGVVQDMQRSALLYKQSLIHFLPYQRGPDCRQEIDKTFGKEERSLLEQEQINWLKNICTDRPKNIYHQAEIYLDETRDEYAPILTTGLAFYLETICDYKPARSLYSRALKAQYNAINR